MPMYDYVCAACGAKFEELCRNGEETAPVCPQCGSADTQRQLSVPSPLKTGAFPFKIGPRPAWMNDKRLNRNSPCHGNCSSCGSSSAGGGE